MSQIKRKRRQRKKSRKFLWITLIVLLILGGAGWGGLHYITHQDVLAEDIGVDQDFFDFSEFDMDVTPDPKPNVDGENVSASKDEATTEDGTDLQSTYKPEDPDDSSIIATTPASEKPGKDDITQTNPAKLNKKQEIKDKYSTTFESLESVAISKLNTLAENALKDYRSGRSLTDLFNLYECC